MSAPFSALRAASLIAIVVSAFTSILGALVVTAPLAAQPAPTGPEIRVDPVAPWEWDPWHGYQPEAPAVAALPGGGFVAVWGEGGHTGYDAPELTALRGRRFGPGGEPSGEAFTIGEDGYWPPYPFHFDVAAAGDGRFLVVWSRREPWGPEGDRGLGVVARLFDAGGQPVGEPFAVHAPRGGDQVLPQAAADEAGGFVVVWQDAEGLRARRFDGGGEPLGEELEPFAEPGLRWPSVAALPRGGFLVAGSVEDEVLFRRFDERGVPTGPSAPAGSARRGPCTAVAAGPDGGVVVVWGGEARRFDPAGLPLGEAVEVAPDGSFCHEWQGSMAVAGDGRGGLLFVWQASSGYPWPYGWPEVVARHLAAGGELSPPFRVGPTRRDVFWQPDAAALEGGELVVVWAAAGLDAGPGGPASGLGVLAQRYATASPGVLQLAASRAVVSEDEGEARLTVTRREGNRGAVAAMVAAAAPESPETPVLTAEVRFEDGDALSREIVVPLAGDRLPEPDEILELRLTAVSGGAALGEPSLERLEIRDDDLPSPLLAAAGKPRLLVEGGFRPLVFPDSEGGLLTVWMQGSQRTNARRFDAAGAPLTPEIELTDPEEFPYVFSGLAAAPHRDGGFTVAWGVDTGAYWIGSSARRFNSEGLPAGEFFSVSEVTPDLLALAPLPDGGLVVAEPREDGSGTGISIEILDPEGDLLTATRANEETFGDQREPALAVDSSGGFLAVWRSFTVGAAGNGLYARLFDADGAPRGPQVWFAEPGEGPLRLAAAPGGGFVAVWTLEGGGAGVRLFDAAGLPVGPELRADGVASEPAENPVVAMGADGRFLVVWRSDRFVGDRYAPRLSAQAFSAAGQRLGAAFPVAPGVLGGQYDAGVAALGDGGYAVVWRNDDPVGSGSVQMRRLAARETGPCIRGPYTLCLAGGRLRVEAEWDDERAGTGRGRALPLADSAGAFWFFRPDNPELVVKVVDGRRVNGCFWLFYGALGDVAHTLTVTDTRSGFQRVFEGRSGRLAAAADLYTFASLPDAAAVCEGPWEAAAGGPPTAFGEPDRPLCTDVPGPRLNLATGRFRAEAQWRDPRTGASGFGLAHRWGERAGAFSFFRPDNPEVAVKIVDGGAVNGRWWVFWTALSDLEVSLTVADTTTGEVRTYYKPPYHLGGGADTAAFLP